VFVDSRFDEAGLEQFVQRLAMTTLVAYDEAGSPQHEVLVVAHPLSHVAFVAN
jgi:hypothetical protein